MENQERQRPSPDEARKPLIENEAVKNTDQVAEDKKKLNLGTDEDLPGYPHYSPEEDVLNPSAELELVDVDVEKIARGGNISAADLKAGSSGVPVNDMEIPIVEDPEDEDDLEIVPGTEADVTKEDLLLLGPKDQDMDTGEDEQLQHQDFPLSATGEDLDVPGEELDDESEDIGEEDEENNYYSLGGDNHQNLEDPE
ncbi:MAG: hypothetical protein WKF97_04710 [Chitinophagaceae bacterium]